MPICLLSDYSHYSSRRHASDDLTARQRQALGPTSPHYRQSSHPQPLIRESSPGIFTSSINTRREGSTPRSYSRERSLPPSGPTSPRATNSSSNGHNVPSQTGDRALPTVTRAKWVLDKVLRNLVSKVGTSSMWFLPVTNKQLTDREWSAMSCLSAPLPLSRISC